MSTRPLSSTIFGALCAVSLCAVAPERAEAQGAPPADQDVDLEALRRRFRDAMNLESKEDWRGALAIFEDIARQKQSPQVRFHVALCQEKLGQLQAAQAGFQEALDLAASDPDNAQDVLDSAPGRITAIADRIPRLVLKIAEGGSADVLLDGVSIGVVDSQRRLSVDPGSHEVAVRENGAIRRVQTFSMAERESLEITVPAHDVPASKADPEPVIVPDDPIPDSTSGTKVPFFLVGGIGIASLVGAGVMVGLRQSAIGEVRDSCSGEDIGCDPALREVAERGERYELAAWGLGAAGVACLGVATVLYFTVGQDSAPAAAGASKTRSATTLRIAVEPTGVRLLGSFE